MSNIPYATMYLHEVDSTKVDAVTYHTDKRLRNKMPYNQTIVRAVEKLRRDLDIYPDTM